MLQDAPCHRTPLAHSSKAIGEPPFFLGASVFFALKVHTHLSSRQQCMQVQAMWQILPACMQLPQAALVYWSSLQAPMVADGTHPLIAAVVCDELISLMCVCCATPAPSSCCCLLQEAVYQARQEEGHEGWFQLDRCFAAVFLTVMQCDLRMLHPFVLPPQLSSGGQECMTCQ
jgi:hypothetical protein